jgi:hypothetical protein
MASPFGASRSHSIGPLWMSDQPVAEISTWQLTTTQGTNTHAPEGFEPTIPANERPRIHSLNRAATGIDN